MQTMQRQATSSRVVAGRRLAVRPMAFAASRVAPVSRSSAFAGERVQAQRAVFRTAQRSKVVVEAVKKSVGDLTEADLKGKRVGAAAYTQCMPPGTRRAWDC